MERAAHRTCEWLGDLSDLRGIDDRSEAYLILRAFLHVVRRQVTVDEAADFAAAADAGPLDVLQAWVPARTPQRWRSRDDLLAFVAERAGLAGPTHAGYPSRR